MENENTRAEEKNGTQESGASSESTSNPNAGADQVKSQFQSAADSIKQIPKKEDLHGLTFEQLFAGRIDKMNFLYAVVLSIVVGFFLMMIPVLGWIASMVLGFVGLGATARRFHDINLTGWYTILALVPVLNLIVILYLIVAEPLDNNNHYGPKPDPKRTFFHALLNI